ncbi:MAG: GHKL domain-containing protein [Clostridiales bacterium]|nr:GHKL domain-containing protein [Clostridiales bacterium]
MTALFETLSGNQYITEMLGACMLFILPHRKRAHFLWRFLPFCGLAELLSLVLMNYGPIKTVWQSPAYIVLSCCIYTGVFAALSAALLALCCPVKRNELIYCAALTLCVQHISSAAQLLLAALIPYEGILADTVVELVTVPLAYWFFYRTCIRPLCEDGEYQVNNLRLTAVTCLVFLVAACTSVAVKVVNENSASPLFPFCQVYEILCCASLLWIQVNQRRALALQHELDMQNYVQQLRHEQLQSSRQNMNELTRLMHDLKHQVAEMIDKEEGADRDDLLDQIAENLQVYDESTQTDNETLNAVLMERSLYCRERQIRVMCVADCTGLEMLETGDLYLILRNTLDNAIESVSRLANPQHRMIDLKIFRRNGLLFIQMENSYQGRLQFRDGLPLTTKEDRRFHGFGLKTVQNIARRYSGELSIRAEAGRFSLRVMLPVAPEQAEAHKSTG